VFLQAKNVSKPFLAPDPAYDAPPQPLIGRRRGPLCIFSSFDAPSVRRAQGPKGY